MVGADPGGLWVRNITFRGTPKLQKEEIKNVRNALSFFGPITQTPIFLNHALATGGMGAHMPICVCSKVREMGCFFGSK